MAAPTSPDNNLDQFFADLLSFVNGSQTPAQKAATLLTFFCANRLGIRKYPPLELRTTGLKLINPISREHRR